MSAEVKAELDRLVARLFTAFDNVGGKRPALERVREVFIPQGMIIKNVGGTTEVYDLDSFIEPRERILTDGTLTGFTEWEIAERTEIAGSIAHRFSEYGKSGYLNGEWFEAKGSKSTQFVRTADGWRMNAVIWDDV
ncbi:MAG: DUF4440 domain-containing protein [Nonomuraea sp.]|nr:DUF4440 domain-containing protein [Nonomuraea sp.]